MRLIDGDELLARYKARCEGCKETKNYCEHCCDIADILNDIEDAPTIEKRKKGKWIRNDNGTYSCSLCQSWIPNEQRYYANFCLYCGADMREENENAEIH